MLSSCQQSDTIIFVIFNASITLFKVLKRNTRKGAKQPKQEQQILPKEGQENIIATVRFLREGLQQVQTKIVTLLVNQTIILVS